MADILGLYAHTTGNDNNADEIAYYTHYLFAVYGNDLQNASGATTNYLQKFQNLTPDKKAEFDTLIGITYMTNGFDAIRSFHNKIIWTSPSTGVGKQGLLAWTTLGVRNHAPRAKYIKTFGPRLYLGYISILYNYFPTRVWYCDLPSNDDIRWGIEWGTNLTQTANSKVVTADSTYFLDYGIKAGDKLHILSGANIGEYTVYSVDTNNKITLVETLKRAASNSLYFVGSNYFDVGKDNNDSLQGFGTYADRLMCFKLFSLYKYTGTTLMEIPGAIGTSSSRSIINNKYLFYFHGSTGDLSGIYLYDGNISSKISGAIQPYIDGISMYMFNEIVAWREGELVRFYVGDISNTQRNISVTKAVLSLNVNTGAWSVDTLGFAAKCATSFILPVSNVYGSTKGIEYTAIGDSDGNTHTMNTGYKFATEYQAEGVDYAGNPIPWAMETGVHYPEGSEMLVKFTRVQIIARDAKGVSVKYKLYDNPKDIDQEWRTLGDIENDKTEFIIPIAHNRASGIDFRLEEISTRENTLSIEKITIFYIIDNSTFV